MTFLGSSKPASVIPQTFPTGSRESHFRGSQIITLKDNTHSKEITLSFWESERNETEEGSPIIL